MQNGRVATAFGLAANGAAADGKASKQANKQARKTTQWASQFEWTVRADSEARGMEAAGRAGGQTIRHCGKSGMDTRHSRDGDTLAHDEDEDGDAMPEMLAVHQLMCEKASSDTPAQL